MSPDRFKGWMPSEVIRNAADGSCGVAEQKEFCYDQTTLRGQEYGANRPVSKFKADLDGNCECNGQTTCRAQNGRCERITDFGPTEPSAYKENLDGSCSCAATDGVCTRMMRSVPDQLLDSLHCFYADPNAVSMTAEGISLAEVCLSLCLSTVYLSLHTHNHTLTHTRYHLYLLL